jgi:hypothetical protein
MLGFYYTKYRVFTNEWCGFKNLLNHYILQLDGAPPPHHFHPHPSWVFLKPFCAALFYAFLWGGGGQHRPVAECNRLINF